MLVAWAIVTPRDTDIAAVSIEKLFPFAMHRIADSSLMSQTAYSIDMDMSAAASFKQAKPTVVCSIDG